MRTRTLEAVFDFSNKKRAVLVSVKVLDNMVDLFDIKTREDDNQDISNFVVNVMKISSRFHQIELNEDLTDADISNNSGVETDKDMLIHLNIRNQERKGKETFMG